MGLRHWVYFFNYANKPNIIHNSHLYKEQVFISRDQIYVCTVEDLYLCMQFVFERKVFGKQLHLKCQFIQLSIELAQAQRWYRYLNVFIAF